MEWKSDGVSQLLCRRLKYFIWMCSSTPDREHLPSASSNPSTLKCVFTENLLMALVKLLIISYSLFILEKYSLVLKHDENRFRFII